MCVALKPSRAIPSAHRVAVELLAPGAGKWACGHAFAGWRCLCLQTAWSYPDCAQGGGGVCGVYEGEGTLPHSLSFLPIFSTTGSPAFWVELIWESSQASHPLEMCTPHC